MSATTVPTTGTTEAAPPPRRGIDLSKLRWAIHDTWAITGRNLLRYVRVPQLLVFTFVQPVMFVLLFRYVFGGAINVPSLDYVNYLMPGIFAQTVVFGAVQTGIGLAEDLNTGIIERFRSLPMSPIAMLGGRTGADLIRNLFVVLVMLSVGLAVGFRPDGGVIRIAAGLALVLGFAFALSWVFVNVGLAAADAESAQAVSFPILFPLTFASSAFVPVSSMPGWLQGFATYQPITVLVNATRSLMLGPDAAGQLRDAGVLEASTAGYTIQAVAWIVVIIVIAAPFAVRRYQNAGTG